MNNKEQIKRDLYLRKLALGIIQGPKENYPSRDKSWLANYSEEAITTTIPDGIPFSKTIREKNKNNLNRIAFNYFGSKYTYGYFFEQIDKYVSKFIKMGIKTGDIVSICMPSTPEAIYAIYALNKMGVICDMIDPRSNPNQMEYYLNEDKSKTLILCENYYNVMKDTVEKMNLDNILLMPITPSAPLLIKLLVDKKTSKTNKNLVPTSNVIKWKEFMDIDESYKLDDYMVNNDDLAAIIHSSGTTSIPKGIMITNKNINSIIMQYYLSPLDLREGDKFLSVIPLFASFGFIASVALPTYLSMNIMLDPIPSPKKFVKQVKKFKPNFCLTIPANFIALMNYGKIKDLSFFRGPGCGGYSLDSSKESEINEFLKSKNCPSPMLMGWGMSELASTACLETPKMSKLLSSGIPLSKNIISAFKVDENGQSTDIELQYGEEGELCVCGPSVMYGYLNNPEKTSKTLRRHRDGKIWLHSGDIGYIDNQGRVYPTDRMSRMIIKGIDGFKMLPQKVEEVITSSQYVDSAVVVGAMGKSGIYPKAYIVIKQEFRNKNYEILEEIKKLCYEKLTVRMIPDEFEIIEELPYTALGKVDFKRLEQYKVEEQQTISTNVSKKLEKIKRR